MRMYEKELDKVERLYWEPFINFEGNKSLVANGNTIPLSDIYSFLRVKYIIVTDNETSSYNLYMYSIIENYTLLKPLCKSVKEAKLFARKHLNALYVYKKEDLILKFYHIN